METQAEQIIKRFNALKSEHSKWTGIWSDVARYCMPTFSPLSDFSAKTRGASKKQPFDPIGIACLVKLASWLYSSTVYQGEQWFDFKAQKKDVNDAGYIDLEEESFLQDAARKTLECISQSNFGSTYQRMLRLYCGFGTGAFYSEFNEDAELVCRQFNVAEGVYIDVSSKGEPDTIFRGFEYTARQAIQEFGEENVSDEIRKASLDVKSQDARFQFIHAVFPRPKNKIERGKKTADNKPIASIYVEIGAKKVVLEGGYDEMPYHTPRFYDTDEIYGRCPTMDAIATIKAVNIATFAYLRNVEGATKPIVFAPTSVYDKFSLEYGAVNPWNSIEGDIKIWTPTGDVKGVIDFILQKREEIGKMFYNDVFQYLEDRKNMTATEAQLRYDEMIQGVSPVLANLQNEFFSPFISRVAKELCRLGKINVPAEFRGEDGENKLPKFEIVYNTRLDTKLKGVLNANIINFVRIIGELGVALGMPQLPSAYIDVDKVVKGYAKNSNVVNDALKSDDEIEASLQAMGEQQQQQMLMDMIDKINLQKTPEQGSVQEAMTRGMTGAPTNQGDI